MKAVNLGYFYDFTEFWRLPITPDSVKPDPEDAMPIFHLDPAADILSLESDELVAQRDYLSLKREARSKAAAQRTKQRTNYCAHGLRRLTLLASRVQAIQ